MERVCGGESTYFSTAIVDLVNDSIASFVAGFARRSHEQGEFCERRYGKSLIWVIS